MNRTRQVKRSATDDQTSPVNAGNFFADTFKRFRVSAQTPEKDVIVVFLLTALFTILSFYFAGRAFFRKEYYLQLNTDPLYPLYEYLYWFSADFLVYFILPVLAIAVFHRRRFRDFGLGLGDILTGLKFVAIFLAVMLPILWFSSSSVEFQAVYPHAQIVKTDWKLFVIYEAFFLLYFIGWEYIWRGYVLFGLERFVGSAVAVLIQMIPFVIFHFGKPLPETLGSVFAAVALGALAVRTRSFWYCVIIHWSTMLTMDMITTLRSHSGISGVGMADIYSIIVYCFK